MVGEKSIRRAVHDHRVAEWVLRRFKFTDDLAQGDLGILVPEHRREVVFDVAPGCAYFALAFGWLRLTGIRIIRQIGFVTNRSDCGGKALRQTAEPAFNHGQIAREIVGAGVKLSIQRVVAVQSRVICADVGDGRAILSFSGRQQPAIIGRGKQRLCIAEVLVLDRLRQGARDHVIVRSRRTPSSARRP